MRKMGFYVCFSISISVMVCLSYAVTIASAGTEGFAHSETAFSSFNMSSAGLGLIFSDEMQTSDLSYDVDTILGTSAVMSEEGGSAALNHEYLIESAKRTEFKGVLKSSCNATNVKEVNIGFRNEIVIADGIDTGNSNSSVNSSNGDGEIASSIYRKGSGSSLASKENFPIATDQLPSSFLLSNSFHFTHSEDEKADRFLPTLPLDPDDVKYVIGERDVFNFESFIPEMDPPADVFEYKLEFDYNLPDGFGFDYWSYVEENDIEFSSQMNYDKKLP